MNRAVDIKALSSTAVQTQSQGLIQNKCCREGGRPDALRPADLNRPETSENQKAMGAPTQSETKSEHV
jgi:hypothetical protein